MNEKPIKRIIFILALFVNSTTYSQEADNNLGDYYYFDTGTAEGITIYGELPRGYDSDSINAYVLNQLNGSRSDRKQFIEAKFLEESGFRRTGNVQFRRSTGAEKASSILYGIGHIFSFGIVPMRPFSEIEHDRLPRGEYYTFESVLIKSNFTNVTPEILTLMKLEYMLQIEFCNGILIRDNINYYTDANINKFESLILLLPDFPETIHQSKNRYLNELGKIRAALERYRNPSENYLRAIDNLGGTFIRSR
jgi:hypothetical protein